MKPSSASIRRLPDTRELPARASLLAVFLCYAGSLQGQEPQLADAGEAPQNRVSLNQSLSQSDIARLRAQASGKSNAAYIAYPQLILNGSATPHMLPTQVYGQELAVETRELEKIGVQFPTPPQAQWQTLNELGIAGRYDNNAQQINLVVPAQWLPQQSLTAGTFQNNTPVQRGQGALLNYDAFSTWQEDGEKTTSASHEARLFGDWGALSSSGVVRWNDADPDTSGDYVRLDSFWRYTNPDRMRTYVVGDTLSGALSWTPTVRLGGVQISRNFASRPDLITFPLPQISGSATLPSALEVFVNDLRLTEQDVQPGPFLLETSPRLTGLGEVQVVTTDTLGRQVSQTVPFYVSPQLLREGYWDYSATVGAPRRFYSARSNDYDDDPVATGVARYGFNDRLTLEATASASESLTNAGAGVVFRPWLLGVSNLALAHGEDDLSQGTQWVAGHEFRTRRFGVSAQYTRRTEGYRDLSNSLDVRPAIESSLQVNGSLNLEQHGSLNASYLDTRQFNDDENRFLVIGYNRTLWRRLSLTLSVNQNLEDSEDRTWLASFNYYLDRGRDRSVQAGARFSHDERDDTTSTLLTLQRPVEQFWDLGWDLAYSPDSDGIRRASGRWWTPYLDVQAGVFRQEDTTSTFANLSGSLVTNYEDVFAANTMNNSFAIVDAGGFADVPVRRANRVIGHTNRNGKLLLPDMVPFTENKLNIDINDLPVDARIGDTELLVKPADLTGITARFSVEQRHSAVLVIHNGSDEPVPAGSRVLFSDADATVVGYDGEVFIQGLQAGSNELGILNDGSLCTVRFDFTPAPGTLPRLGPFTCRPTSDTRDP
ncbi:fimbria/pilus outer membrane usher protein [uncultured Alcanivorax sp.]|uniref:fimbria/pilus outer membrane usher protein n=1 Tax=uncultured Alcanivorax sp. TaxID=191215 RepID=UPI00260802B5|nr:fimbria/pilus outer membrane usher protein [uncultured Alcanivorax sp.]